MPQPLIFNEISYVPAIEVAIHRGLWSFIILFLILSFFTKTKDILLSFNSTKKVIILSITASLILINWIGFIYAVSINKVQDASMGYFLTPMISILLGYLFLNEKIHFLKLVSVILMFCSIIFLFISLKSIPIIPLLIGTSWGIYGLLRKQVKILPEIGLLYESFLITIFSVPYLFYLYYQDVGFFLNDTYTSIFLVLTGVVTIIPLFFFNLGLRFIPLGLAGVLFYLAPTFHFITSVFILKETIVLSKMIAFTVIWIAVIIFIFDVIKRINVSNTQ